MSFCMNTSMTCTQFDCTDDGMDKVCLKASSLFRSSKLFLMLFLVSLWFMGVMMPFCHHTVLNIP